METKRLSETLCETSILQSGNRTGRKAVDDYDKWEIKVPNLYCLLSQICKCQGAKNWKEYASGDLDKREKRSSSQDEWLCCVVRTADDEVFL